MAKKLTLDLGFIELDINGNGLLRFNPSDPNVYQRFYALAKELPKMETKYRSTFEPEDSMDETAAAGALLTQMKAFDADVKNRLSAAFGDWNDFDKLLSGVNLMAIGSNGQRIITNLLEALSPYVQDGAKRYRESVAAEAVAVAERERAVRKEQ